MEEPAPPYFVAYAPYLPLGDFQTIGPWQLIPRHKLEAEDAAAKAPVRLAKNFAELFELPAPNGSPCGAFLHLLGTRFGVEPADVDQRLMHAFLALALAVIDANPSALDHNRDPNAGHRSMTSENARIAAARISDEGYTTLLSGSRVPRLDMGVYVGEGETWLKGQKLPPPADLRIPSFPVMNSFAYASAAHESVARNTKAARRLRRAILWLTLAWLNTEGLTDDLRVPALRAGFEVLLSREKSLQLARVVAQLLEDDTAKRERTWKANKQARAARLSDIAWWFMRFSLLRNELMHGTEPPPDAWRHNKIRHVNLAEAYLRLAIKAAIAKDNKGLRNEMAIQRQVKALRQEMREQKGSI